MLAAGLGGGALAVAGAGAAGFELVSRGVLPGKTDLARFEGACSVPAPRLSSGPTGPSRSGSFFSAVRRRAVGYTIACPPGHRPGARLPLVIALHGGGGGDHRHTLIGMTPARAVALRPAGRPLTPMALVTVDGGAGYWNPHPGDDPMAMVTGELIPLCHRLGPGRAPQRIAVMGISMGGYGAPLLAERYPRLFAAVAAISPAIWTSYAQARAANPRAYASARAFAEADAVTHAGALAEMPVRVASAYDDPSTRACRRWHGLPPGAVTGLSPGLP